MGMMDAVAAFQSSRYHLPDTPYFADLRRTISFDNLVGYAQAERLARLVGGNFVQTPVVPVSWSQEYSPFGATLVEIWRKNPTLAEQLLGLWNEATVATPADAILGLGRAPHLLGRSSQVVEHLLRAEAAKVIMAGKCKIFGQTAAVNATPLCIRTYLNKWQQRELEGMPEPQARKLLRRWHAQNFAEALKAVACNYKFLNVEDAAGSDLPAIFSVLESLEGECTYWSDDLMGTGVIAAATVLSWAKLTDRQMQEVRVIIFGAGAGAKGVYDELINHGIPRENIICTDRGPGKDESGMPHVLHEGRSDVDEDPYKVEMRRGIPEGTTVESFLDGGVDIVINLQVKETVTRDRDWTTRLHTRLRAKPLCMYLTNPDPGIYPEDLRLVRSDAFYSSGNQRYPNTANNFTVFGYMGAGALMAHARRITPAMTKAAALGIVRVAEMGPSPELLAKLPSDQQEFGPSWLVPRPDDRRLLHYEAREITMVAAEAGVSLMLGPNPTRRELDAFATDIDRQVAVRSGVIDLMREQAAESGPRRLQVSFPDRFGALHLKGDKVYDVAPEVNTAEFLHFAGLIGVSEASRKVLLDSEGVLRPKVMTEILERLIPEAEGESEAAKLAFKELTAIIKIMAISPALALALAVRRTSKSRHPGNWVDRLTVFHRAAVLKVTVAEIPQTRDYLYREFSGLPSLEEAD